MRLVTIFIFLFLTTKSHVHPKTDNELTAVIFLRSWRVQGLLTLVLLAELTQLGLIKSLLASQQRDPMVCALYLVVVSAVLVIEQSAAANTR